MEEITLRPDLGVRNKRPRLGQKDNGTHLALGAVHSRNHKRSTFVGSC